MSWYFTPLLTAFELESTGSPAAAEKTGNEETRTIKSKTKRWELESGSWVARMVIGYEKSGSPGDLKEGRVMFWVGMDRWAVSAAPSAAQERGPCWSALKVVQSETSVAGKVSRGRRGGHPQINAGLRRFFGWKKNLFARAAISSSTPVHSNQESAKICVESADKRPQKQWSGRDKGVVKSRERVSSCPSQTSGDADPPISQIDSCKVRPGSSTHSGTALPRRPPVL